MITFLLSNNFSNGVNQPMTKSYNSDSAFVKELAKLKKKNPQLHYRIELELIKLYKRRKQIQNGDYKHKSVKYYDETWQLTVEDVRVTFDVVDLLEDEKEIYCKKLFFKKSNTTPKRHKKTTKKRGKKDKE